VKASRVKGLRPGSKLGGAAQRIAKQRILDLLALDAAVRDPANVRELHDLRIAAKRLRYTLEVLGEVLGPAAGVVEDEARALQDILGEVHDCDVLGPRLEQELAKLAADDARAVAELAHGDPDAAARVLRDAPGRATRQGVQALAVGVAARRALLYERFLLRWDALLAGSALTALTHPS
jgi:CHAD domain-containing protein